MPFVAVASVAGAGVSGTDDTAREYRESTRCCAGCWVGVLGWCSVALFGAKFGCVVL